MHGDEIIIGPGTYTRIGNWVINPTGKRLWIHSSDGPEVTIIDGEGVRLVIQCASGETSQTIFEGLTITGGYGTYGGGMFNFNNSPTLTNCTFTGNTATWGGGIYSGWGNNPTLIDTTVCGNTPDQIWPTGSWTDNGGNTVADVCPIDCPDINVDGNVDVNDLLILIADWGTCTDNCVGDVNEDGTVDIEDLLVLIAAWGPCE